MTPASNTFTRLLDNSFNAAWSNGAGCTRFFRLGSHIIRMKLAGDAMARSITPAFEHLATPPQPHSSLDILLWDDVTTKTTLPPFPWANLSLDQQFAAVNRLNTAQHYLAFNEFGGILNGYDNANSTAYFWVNDARSIPTHEWSTPLRNILHWVLMRRGDHLVHGGAVGIPEGGVLLVGKGGSGKSTSAVACLNSELLYAADDYAMLSLGSPPTVYSIYSTAKLHGETLERVSHVVPAVANPDELANEKAIVMLNETWRSKLILQFPLRAILVPRVTGQRDTRLVPATTNQAASALMISTVSILPRTEPFVVQRLLELVRSVPAYTLELGTDMRQIPAAILRLLESGAPAHA